MLRPWRRPAGASLALLLLATMQPHAEPRARRQFPQERAAPAAKEKAPGKPEDKQDKKATDTKDGASPPATSTPPPETKPYDPQLMRLAEILGALTYLRGLCGDKDADTWRQRMQALLDAEGTPQVRKDRLAGAYNRGLQGYSLSYRTCTANARFIIQRFLAEGERIAKEIENRYRAT